MWGIATSARVYSPMVKRLRLHWTAAIVALGATIAACDGNEAIVCSSDTKNAGAGCVATYDLCKGGTYKLQCDPAPSGVSCACIENNALKSTFKSEDACNVSPDTLRKRAASNCNWQLD